MHHTIGKHTIVIIVNLVLMIALSLSATSCGGSGSARSVRSDSADTLALRYSSLLTITDHGGFMQADVRNPWDSTKLLHRYILVDRGASLPDDLPQGTIIRTPVDNALVFSAVHVGLLNTLGALDAVGGVCDPQYMHDPEIAGRIKDGRIIDCGNGNTPDIEKIMQERPQAIFLSPFQNSNNSYGKVSELGIPIVECADYMENSPLGRAEWMRFYGRLFGKEHDADSLFNATEKRYMTLKEMTDTMSKRPRVLMDQRYGQVWNVPAKNSTMGIFIKDAGGENPFADLGKGGGSVALSPEKVLTDAHDAEIWFVRYNQRSPKTLAELGRDAAVNSRFDAYRSGNVFGCNTSEVDFYGEVPFHPDRLLADMICCIHPGLDTIVKPEYRYFTKMK